MQDSDLDDLFGAARAPVAVPAALMARVLADADAVQPVARTLMRRRPRLMTGLLAAIGGIGGLAGLSTAAMAGVWLGFAQPAALTAVTDSFLTDTFMTGNMVTETVNILPGFDDFLDEG